MNNEGFWKKILRFLADFKQVLPYIKSDEQIRLSWLTRLRAFYDVPDIYRRLFEQLIGSSEFPYALITPSYAGISIQGRESLVFCLNDKIFDISTLAGIVIWNYHLLDDILFVEVGRALLHSWVKICSKSDSDMPLITEYKFNTTSEYIFEPIVERIRKAIVINVVTFLRLNQSSLIFSIRRI